MKNKFVKVISVLSVALLLVVGSVFATYAYLTAKSAQVTNTFTVGKVAITLDESELKTDGTLDTTKKVTANSYVLLPGKEYPKDPTIHVTANSEESYLEAVVTINNYTIIKKYADTDAKVYGLFGLASGWSGRSVTDNGDTATVILQYANTVAKSTSVTDVPVFTTFTAPNFDEEDEFSGDFTIVVEGRAIQASGFDSVDAALTALETAVAEEQ